MCNFYNTAGNVNGYSGCGCHFCGNGNFGLWGCGRQWMCRDCNGNIRVNQRNTCGRGCNNGCGGSATGNTTNGNGGFTCVTFCGNTGVTTNNVGGGDLYYARQYGLYPYGYNRGCGCVLDALGEN